MPSSPLPEAIRDLTWLDWAVLATLALFMAAGVGRGLVLGALDLLTSVASLAVAVLGYRQAAALAHQQVPELPEALAGPLAFLALLVVTQWLIALAIGLTAKAMRPLLVLLGPLRTLDRALGVLPGLAKGLLVATMALLPFAVFPLVPSLTAAIEGSRVAGRLTATVASLAPDVESLLGREVGGMGSLGSLAPPQTGETRHIPLGQLGTLEPDPRAEAEMLDLVNRERTRAGLPPLAADERLREVARAHSREMFQAGYFSHTSPSTGSPFDRLRRAGIPFLAAGENLAYAPSVQIAHEGLMNSPGHRANILRAEFGRVGIGAIRSQLRGTMFTQAFTN